MATLIAESERLTRAVNIVNDGSYGKKGTKWGGMRCRNALEKTSAKSGDSYNGFFLLSNASEATEATDDAEATTTYQIGIADGDPNVDSEAPAGYAVINDVTIEIPTGVVAPTSSGVREYIYASFTLQDGVTPVFDGYGISTSYPCNDDLNIKFLLGTIYFSGTSFTIFQQHNGMIYGWIFRHCSDVVEDSEEV